MGTRSVWAGESTSLSTAVSHKVYTPKILSADAAKAYLAQARARHVSQLPMANGLLITGDPSSLNTIQTVLKVVDVDLLYEIRLAGSDSLLANLPSRDRIAAAIGDIAVGALDASFRAEGKAPVIIDRHRGQVLVIAPKDKMDRIMALVEGKVIIPSLDQDVLGTEIDKIDQDLRGRGGLLDQIPRPGRSPDRAQRNGGKGRRGSPSPSPRRPLQAGLRAPRPRIHRASTPPR